MDKTWYRAINGQPDGPYTSAEIQSMALSGTLKPDDLVTKHGSNEWFKASQIQNVKFQAPPQAAPMQPQVQQVATPQMQPVAAAHDIAADVRRKHDSSNQTKILIAAGLLFVSGIGVTALIMSNLNGNDQKQVVAAPQPRSHSEEEPRAKKSDKSEDLTKELKEERDSLRKEVKTLREDKDELEQERSRLQREIENFTSRLEFIDKSRSADFVMINPTHFSVSLKVENDGLRVISKAEGVGASDTLGACRNWHIPRMRHNPALTRVVFQRTKSGELIPQDLTKKIRNEFWKPHRYSPYAPELNSSDIDLVVFRDLETFKLQTGYFLTADKSGLDYFPLGSSEKRIKWADVQAGSARRGPSEEILRNYKNSDFLEYCIMRVAQKIGSNEIKGDLVDNARPTVLIYVDLDVPDDHLKFYDKLDKQLEEQGRPPAFEHAEGFFGIMASLISEGNRANIVNRRKALHEEMLRTDPHKRLRHLSRYLEDEVMAKLSKCGVAPITEVDRNLIASSSMKDTLKATAMHDATHLLRVMLKPSRSSGDYHLSVRLYHEDGRSVWIDEGDRNISASGVGDQYHLSSGQPALVYLENQQHFDSFVGRESPPIMPRVKKPSIRERYSHLVFLENEKQSETILHRTLFQDKIFETPRDHFSDVKYVESFGDIPQDHILPYITLRLAESVLPITGRVSQTNKKAAVISISAKHRLKSGDRLRVLRVDAEPESLTDTLKENNRFSGLFAHGKSLLPTELVVTKAAKDQISVTISSTGLEDAWPENIPLRINDLVLVNTRDTQVLALDKLVVTEIDPKLAIRIGMANPITRKRRLAEIQTTATQIEELIASALTNLHVPVIQKSASSLRSVSTQSRQANLRLHGNITLSSKMNSKARAAAVSIFRLELKVSPANSNEVLEQFDFDLKDFIMPN